MIMLNDSLQLVEDEYLPQFRHLMKSNKLKWSNADQVKAITFEDFETEISSRRSFCGTC